MRPFWTPEPMWRAQTAFVLGSGPSLTPDVCDQLRGRNVIAVNGAYVFAPWAPVLFFSDTKWFRNHRAIVESWGGMVVTHSRFAAAEMPDKVKRILGEIRPGFPVPGSTSIRHGRSSGQKGASLAVAMGASLVVLVGFDMREVNGRTHFHDEYRNDPKVYAKSFIPWFNGWHAEACKVGCEIVNATPGSALKEFPFVSLDDVLGLAAAA